MRRLAIAFFLLAAACGLTFSPGDYREPTELGPGANPDGGVPTNEGGSNPAEGGTGSDAGPGRTRIALFTGRRDALPGETGGQITIAETMLTSIATDGTLGPITFDSPPSATNLWTNAVLAGGEIYLHTSSAIVHAPFTDHVNGTWSLLSIPPAPETGVRGWVVDGTGVLSGRASAGSNTQAWRAAFADGGIGDWLNLSAKTTVARGNTRVVRASANVYLLGGETPEGGTADDPIAAIPAHAEVEVAKLGANGEPGDFHATAALPTPAFDPVAVGSSDRLYVLGGLGASAATSITDVAFAAKIKDTGDLDSWVTLPKLPQPMTAFAAVVTPSWLVVIGGQTGSGGTAKTTANILRLAIRADGTFGSSWENAGELPGGRSNLVGVTY